jgi:hypothetical protein
MTFYGYDANLPSGLEEAFVRYSVTSNLMELFSETNAGTIPFDTVKLPYDFIFVETNDRVSPDVVICGVMASKSENWRRTIKETRGDGNGGIGIILRPIYKIKGSVFSPVEFEIFKDGETIEEVRVTWSTMTKKASDIGLYEDHPLVKRSSWYCWLVVAMVCIYVTCSDADVLLGIDTKEYRKLSAKKNPKKAKLQQLRNTRYLGTKITIDRKIVDRKLSSKGGTHASPVPHWRTGHFRHLDSGKVVWIRPCIVGYGAGKQIPVIKKYLLK